MIKTFSITDIGRQRKVNQDYVFTSEQPVGNLPNLFIVADGMGGHKAGDFASKYAVETIINEVAASDKSQEPVLLLKDAISMANERVYQKSMLEEKYEGMGTTVVAATIKDDLLYVANVGDSRLYIMNDSITQITRDHSLVEEMVQMGGLDRKEARVHPDKNIITRAVGVQEYVEVDFFQVELKEGDLILMCSDGLTNMLEDEEIRMILEGQRDIVEKASGLVDAANENGGKDNIAVILIKPCMEEERA